MREQRDSLYGEDSDGCPGKSGASAALEGVTPGQRDPNGLHVPIPRRLQLDASVIVLYAGLLLVQPSLG